MNYFLFLVKSSLDDFRRHKIRTFLTSLGILIGVASVVLLISFGLGLKRYIQNQFENLGTNLLMVLPGKVLQGGLRPGGGALGGVNFDEKDVLKLKKIKTAEFVVPVFIKTVKVSSGSKTEIGDLYATSADIFAIRNLEIVVGAKFTKTDNDKRSKKAVLGPKLAEKIFGSIDNAWQKTIKIDQQSFRVAGILKPKGGSFAGPDFDSFIYIPYKSASSFNPSKKFFALNIKVKSQDLISQTKQEVKKILSRRYDEDDFSVIEQTEIAAAVSSIFSILNIVLIAIAAISLIVGGIGIMNIMYVTVVERTKEIGIRRAIGATKRDILWQFLFESVILSVLGALIGLIIASAIIILVQKIFPAYINLTSVAVALGISSIIGVIFGVFPARKAANLSPIDAIRYE